MSPYWTRPTAFEESEENSCKYRQKVNQCLGTLAIPPARDWPVPSAAYVQTVRDAYESDMIGQRLNGNQIHCIDMITLPIRAVIHDLMCKHMD